MEMIEVKRGAEVVKTKIQSEVGRQTEIFISNAKTRLKRQK